MTFPVAPVVLPSDLVGVPNGRLFANQLESVFLPGWGFGHLHPKAKQAFDCFFLAAKLGPLSMSSAQMSATSPADTYRDYGNQETVFRARYRPTWTAACRSDRAGKTWHVANGGDGRFWFQLARVALAAEPGTSRHGLGLAVDVAVWTEVSSGRWKILPVQGNQPLFAWMLANAHLYGLAWEAQSESWHMNYVAGDLVPDQVRNMLTYLGVPVV